MGCRVMARASSVGQHRPWRPWGALCPLLLGACMGVKLWLVLPCREAGQKSKGLARVRRPHTSLGRGHGAPGPSGRCSLSAQGGAGLSGSATSCRSVSGNGASGG